MHAKFDFPVQAEPSTFDGEKRSTQLAKRGETRRGSANAEHNRVKLSEVIEAGILPAPLKLVATYKGKEFEADLLPDGTVSLGKVL